MRVRALRGVCIGPGQHLAAGDVAETDAATAQFLISIRAVEKVESPVEVEAKKPISKPEKAGKEK